MYRAFLLGLGAFAAWGLWIGEVCWVKKWRGLAWLSGFNWSALPICFVIVALCCLFVNGRQKGWGASAKFLGVGSLIALAAFVLERWAAFELFSGGAPAGLNAWVVAALVMGAALVPVALPWVANRWLTPVSYRAVIYLAAALLLVLPLSFATIQVVPAVNGSTDQIHAIKMGYPVFWTALLLPIALRLGQKRLTSPSAGASGS